MSTISAKTSSTTDGIDVLGNASSDNFVNWNASWSGRIVRNSGFKRAMLALILIDSLLLGLATFDFVSENQRAHNAFSGLSIAFNSLFTIELLLRLVHYRAGFFTDGWSLFDSVVIGISWIFSFLAVVRPFRVIRTLRLATRIEELRNTALVTHEIFPKLFAVGFVMLLSLYIFSVMFTDLYRETYREGYTEQDYFSRIDLTAFTLFQMMTLDDWSTIVKEVQQGHRLAWLPFCLFVVVSFFCILNLTIAIVYEAFFSVQQQDRVEQELKLCSYLSLSPMSFAKRLDRKENPMQADKDNNSDHVLRLEEKVDKLTEMVEAILRRQTLVQSSVSIIPQSK
jgi:hypothetical protein